MTPIILLGLLLFGELEPLNILFGLLGLIAFYFAFVRFYFVPVLEVKENKLWARSMFRKTQYFEDISQWDITVFSKYITIHQNLENHQNLNGFELVNPRTHPELVNALKAQPFKSIKSHTS